MWLPFFPLVITALVPPMCSFLIFHSLHNRSSICISACHLQTTTRKNKHQQFRTNFTLTPHPPPPSPRRQFIRFSLGLASQFIFSPNYYYPGHFSHPIPRYVRAFNVMTFRNFSAFRRNGGWQMANYLWHDVT